MDKTNAPYGGVASPSELGGGRKKEKWRWIPFTSPGLCYFLRLDQERLTTPLVPVYEMARRSSFVLLRVPISCQSHVAATSFMSNLIWPIVTPFFDFVINEFVSKIHWIMCTYQVGCSESPWPGNEERKKGAFFHGQNGANMSVVVIERR